MAILLSLSLAIGMFSGIGVSAEETEETREEQEIQELWTPEEEAEEALNRREGACEPPVGTGGGPEHGDISKP